MYLVGGFNLILEDIVGNTSVIIAMGAASTTGLVGVGVGMC